jgi:hypothetical protein
MATTVATTVATTAVTVGTDPTPEIQDVGVVRASGSLPLS